MLSLISNCRCLVFLVFVKVALISAAFGFSPPAPKPPTPPVEAALREVLRCIHSGNAHKLYPLFQREEREKEKLTEEQLTALLRVFSRCIKGATPGPVILNGTDDNLTGVVMFRMGSNKVLQLVAYCYKSPEGIIGARGLTWALIMAIADRLGNWSGNMLTSDLNRKKATLEGLKKLRDELKSDTPKLILGPIGTLSFDQLISRQEGIVQDLEPSGRKGH